MNHNDHVWANGALVCNCGARRKEGASKSAPPGWPSAPPEPVCDAPDSPVLVEFHAIDATTHAARLVLAGKDISQFVNGATFQARVGALHEVSVSVVGIGLDLTLPARVTMDVTAYPGYVLIEQPQPDGSRRWRVEREQEA